MSKPLGKGSLTKLDELKKEHGPKFKAAAPKRRKRGPLCLYFRCKSARLVESPIGLRLQGGWCKLKCPRKQLEDYLWLLERTRHWRRQGKWSSEFWWGAAIKKRDELREVLRR